MAIEKIESKYFCKKCDKQFEYYQSRWRHEKICKDNKKEILELSTKVESDRAQLAWEQFNQFLEKHGIDPRGKQEPKTRTALEFFANLIQNNKFL